MKSANAHGLILLFLILLFVPFTALCQQTLNHQGMAIRGKVTDEKNNPLQYVTIYIAHPSTPMSPLKGMATDHEGKFALPVTAPGEYILNASMIGCKSFSTKIKVETEDVEAGHIMLEVSGYTLGEVTIRPSIVVTADRVTFNMEHDPDRLRSNLLNMIAKMPLIGISESGKIYVESPEKSFIVLRKGREDALFNFGNLTFEEILVKLPAMGFTAFEIWRSPPEKYAKYDYVINILPDPQARLFGMVGKSSVDQFFYMGSTGLEQGFTGSAGIFRFSGGVGAGFTHAPTVKTLMDRTVFETANQPQHTLSQSSESRARGEQYTFNLQSSVDISKRQFINFYIKFADNALRNTTKTSSRSAIGTDVMENFYRSVQHNSGKTWQGIATYQLDFKKQSRYLNISYLLESSPKTGKNQLTYHHDWSADAYSAETTKSKTSHLNHRFQINYGESFSERKYIIDVLLGYLSSDYDQSNRVFDAISDVEYSDRFSSLRQPLKRFDGNARFTWNPMRRLSVNAGLDVDYLSNKEVTESTMGAMEHVVPQTGLLASPYIGVKWLFADDISFKIPNYGGMLRPSSGIMCDYRQKKLRPSTAQLSNFVNKTDDNHITTGNPNLSPEVLHIVNFSLSSRFLSPIITVRYVDNAIAQITTLGEDGVTTIQTYENAAKRWQANARLNKRIALFKQPFNFGVGGEYSALDIPGEKLSKEYLFHASATHHLSNFLKKFVVISSLMYRNNWSSGFSGSRNERPFSLNIQIASMPTLKQADKALQFNYNIFLHDILNWSSRTKSFTHSTLFDNQHIVYSNRIPIGFSISCTFGKFKVKPPRSARSKVNIEGFSGGNLEL